MTEIAANVPRQADSQLLEQLKGTNSRLLSQTARFAMSARILGPVRVTNKLMHRALKHLKNKSQRAHRLGNLDALHQCSWVADHSGLNVIDSQVSPTELLEFQNEMRYPRYYYFATRRIRYSLWHYV